MRTNGTQVPCEVPSLHNPTTRQCWPHHRGLRPLLFSNRDVGSFMSHKNKSLKVLWDRTYGFSSSSENTRKSNHLQMSLQKVALCSHEPATSRSVDRRSPNWATRAHVFSENNKAVNKQLKANAVNFIQAVFSRIPGTEKELHTEKLQKFLNSTHCKILEWDVMNKKMNSNQ